jgi:hypothetical protein
VTQELATAKRNSAAPKQVVPNLEPILRIQPVGSVTQDDTGAPPQFAGLTDVLPTDKNYLKFGRKVYSGRQKEIEMAKRCYVLGVILFSAALLVPVFVLAQTMNGSISGTVVDPSGAAVPGAELTLTAVGTRAVAKTTSDPAGIYSFADVLPGTYELTVTAKGFRNFVQRGLTMNIDQKVRLDVTLNLGETNQTIEVSANASPLNFESPVQKGTIPPDAITQIPLVLSGSARSAANFVKLVPGAVSAGDEDRLSFNTRIDGGVNEGDEALVDGASVIDGSLGQNGKDMVTSGHSLAPDAIQEITLLTSNYDPQYGATTSSVMTAITKSGTDNFHGAFYGMLRNRALNARQWGVPDRPFDIESEFGADVGGPVKIPGLAWSGTKKTYGFFNFYGYRPRGQTFSPIYSFPTMQERQGDFSDWKDSSGNLIPVYDPDTTAVNPATGAITRNQFMGCNGNTPNVICPSDPRLANSLAPQWFKHLPAPNLPGILNNYTPPVPPPSGSQGADIDLIDVRVDHYWRDRDHFAVTVHYAGSFGSNEPMLRADPTLSPDAYSQPDYQFLDRLNWDHTFRPTLLNTFNYGYNEVYAGTLCSDAPYAKNLPKLPGMFSNDLPPVIDFESFYSWGCNEDHKSPRPVNIATDRLVWVRGRHTVGIGGEYRALEYNTDISDNHSGTFNFSRLSTGLLGVNSGNDVASFLLGDVSSENETIQTLDNQYIRQKYGAIYAGDAWKVNNKFTLTYGLRWDFSTPTTDKFDRVSEIDPNLANPAAGNRPGALVFSGNYAGSASLGRAMPDSTYYKSFAPRIGFAYSVTPKNVVRAGYGIFYEILIYPGWSGGLNTGRDGFNNTVAFSSTNGGLTPAGLLQNGFAGKDLGTLPPFLNVTYDNGKNPGLYRQFQVAKPPYAQQFNFTLEHQFTPDFYFTAAYVGNVGKRLPSQMVPLNALDLSYLSMGSKLYDEFQPGETTLDGVSIPYAGWVQQMAQCAPSVAQALVPYPQFCGPVENEGENTGSSTFNSFQLKVERRFKHGFWIQSAYTDSKYMSTGSDVQSGLLAGQISPYQRQRNYSLDAQDAPQVLSIAGIYRLPFGKGQRFLNMGGGVNKVVEGWQLSSIFHAASALPLEIRSSSCDVPSQVAAACIPGLLPGANPFAQSKSSFDPSKPLLNAASFENGTNGGAFAFYLGQGARIPNIRGFGYHNQDLSLMKENLITERIKFQFRADFFNVWNWHVFSQGTTFGQGGAFVTDLASPAFGLTTGSVTAPRSIELGVRLIY